MARARSTTNPAMWWAIGAFAAVVIALTLYAALSGGSHHSTAKQHNRAPSTGSPETVST